MFSPFSSIGALAATIPVGARNEEVKEVVRREGEDVGPPKIEQCLTEKYIEGGRDGDV